MGKVVRRFCCAVIVLAVGVVWLYLPSFAFSRPAPVTVHHAVRGAWHRTHAPRGAVGRSR